VNLTVTQLVKIGSTPVSFQLGGRYYAEKPEGGPDWGLRLTATIVFRGKGGAGPPGHPAK
jgi:hypothetical protein